MNRLNQHERGLASSSGRFAGAMAMLAFTLLLAPLWAAAQITPVSQNRYVTASSNCTTGCVPMSQTFTAADFNPFNMTATANSGEGLSFGTGVAAQNSTIVPGSISGTASASRSSRNGSANADSNCTVTFRIAQACSFMFSATSNGPIPSFARLTGPFGVVFDFTLLSGMSVSPSGLLAAGEYTFRAQSTVGGGGGSQMSAGASIMFNLSLSGLQVPAVLAGPIRNPANCHRYYQLSTSGWLEADAMAQQMGGHLVSINDAAEQAWVFSTFAPLGPEYKWIGLTSLAQPGSTNFAWTSGETVSYTNWLGSGPQPGAGDFVLYLSSNTPFPGRWIQNTNSYSINIVGGVVEVGGAGACACDWHADGEVNSVDFFEFLTDFFAGTADIDCSGQTTSGDFFEFLTCFFEGCP